MLAVPASEAAQADLHSLQIAGQIYWVKPPQLGIGLEVVDPISGFLPAWNYRQHIQALRTSVENVNGKVRLNSKRLVASVLSQTNLAHYSPALVMPLVLWWITGGNTSVSLEGSLVTVGAVQMRLRPWSEQQRNAALSHCYQPSQDGKGQLDVIGYLEAMIAHTLQEVIPAIPLNELDAACTTALIEAVVQLNVAEADSLTTMLSAENAEALTQQTAQRILRLCRALGWTPSQVLATPAVEIDRLIALLNVAEPALPVTKAMRPPVTPKRSRRLADMPDAIVIRIEDAQV